MERARTSGSPAFRRARSQRPILRIRIRSTSRTSVGFQHLTRPGTAKGKLRKVCWEDEKKTEETRDSTREMRPETRERLTSEGSSEEAGYEPGKEEGNVEELTTICYDVLLKVCLEGSQSLFRPFPTAFPCIDKAAARLATATLGLSARIPSKPPAQCL